MLRRRAASANGTSKPGGKSESSCTSTVQPTWLGVSAFPGDGPSDVHGGVGVSVPCLASTVGREAAASEAIITSPPSSTPRPVRRNSLSPRSSRVARSTTLNTPGAVSRSATENHLGIVPGAGGEIQRAVGRSRTPEDRIVDTVDANRPDQLTQRSRRNPRPESCALSGRVSRTSIEPGNNATGIGTSSFRRSISPSP